MAKRRIRLTAKKGKARKAKPASRASSIVKVIQKVQGGGGAAASSSSGSGGGVPFPVMQQAPIASSGGPIGGPSVLPSGVLNDIAEAKRRQQDTLRTIEALQRDLSDRIVKAELSGEQRAADLASKLRTETRQVQAAVEQKQDGDLNSLRKDMGGFFTTLKALQETTSRLADTQNETIRRANEEFSTVKREKEALKQETGALGNAVLDLDQRQATQARELAEQVINTQFGVASLASKASDHIQNLQAMGLTVAQKQAQHAAALQGLVGQTQGLNQQVQGIVQENGALGRGLLAIDQRTASNAQDLAEVLDQTQQGTMAMVNGLRAAQERQDRVTRRSQEQIAQLQRRVAAGRAEMSAQGELMEGGFVPRTVPEIARQDAGFTPGQGGFATLLAAARQLEGSDALMSLRGAAAGGGGPLVPYNPDSGAVVAMDAETNRKRSRTEADEL